MHVLIDADVIRYQSGFSAETPIWNVVVGGKVLATFRYKRELDEYCKDLKYPYDVQKDKDVAPVAHALANARDKIKNIILRTNADKYTLYLTGKGNFREEIATIKPYKGNRDSTHKPYHFDSLTRYLTENWSAQTVEGIEADDAMATYQYSMCEADTSVIATIDKDLDMVPGWRYDWGKDILYHIDEDTGITWFYCQLIMGDMTDNIQGVRGAGKAKARKVLMDCETEEDMYWATLDLYCAAYERPMEALIENARLLWMIREEGVMWNPPC